MKLSVYRIEPSGGTFLDTTSVFVYADLGAQGHLRFYRAGLPYVGLHNHLSVLDVNSGDRIEAVDGAKIRFVVSKRVVQKVVENRKNLAEIKKNPDIAKVLVAQSGELYEKDSFGRWKLHKTLIPSRAFSKDSAFHPDAPEEARIPFLENYEFLAALHPTATKETWKKVADSSWGQIGIALNLNTPTEIVDALSDHEYESVRLAVSLRRNITPGATQTEFLNEALPQLMPAQAQFWGSQNFAVLSRLFGLSSELKTRGYTPKSKQVWLSNEELLAENADCDTADLLAKRGIRAPNVDDGTLAASSPNPEELIQLYSKNPEGLEQSILSNPCTPTELLRKIWDEGKLKPKDRKYWVSNHPNCPLDLKQVGAFTSQGHRSLFASKSTKKLLRVLGVEVPTLLAHEEPRRDDLPPRMENAEEQFLAALLSRNRGRLDTKIHLSTYAGRLGLALNPNTSVRTIGDLRSAGIGVVQYRGDTLGETVTNAYSFLVQEGLEQSANIVLSLLRGTLPPNVRHSLARQAREGGEAPDGVSAKLWEELKRDYHELTIQEHFAEATSTEEQIEVASRPGAPYLLNEPLHKEGVIPTEWEEAFFGKKPPERTKEEEEAETKQRLLRQIGSYIDDFDLTRNGLLKKWGQLHGEENIKQLEEMLNNISIKELWEMSQKARPQEGQLQSEAFTQAAKDLEAKMEQVIERDPSVKEVIRDSAASILLSRLAGLAGLSGAAAQLGAGVAAEQIPALSGAGKSLQEQVIADSVRDAIQGASS